MHSIENAIREALAKVDAGDATMRQRVYGSVWTAHERSLAANPSLDHIEKARRREWLKSLIADIESEYRPAAPAIEPVARADRRVEPRFEAAPRPRAAPRYEPEPEFEDMDEGPEEEEPFDEPEVDSDEMSVRPQQEERAAQPRRRSYAMFFALVTLFAVVGVGVIWSVYSGIFAPSSDQAVPVKPTELPPEDFTISGDHAGSKGGQSNAQWITVFDPADPTQISVSGAATADVTKNGEEQFARLRSSTADAEVRFDVGQGVLDKLGGGPVVFDLTLKAEGDAPTQIAVRCDFGSLAACDRKRYEVGITRQDYLLEVQFPEGIHPGSGGTIAINTDIAGTGNAVDVYAIRARSGR